MCDSVCCLRLFLLTAGSAETKVTYLPDGAVVVVFPSNLTIALESGGNPVLENQHRMHFKRKLIAPNKLVHRLEWRFYLRRKGRPKEGIAKLGRRMRVGGVFTRHESMLDSHEAGGYKEKALLVCQSSPSCQHYWGPARCGVGETVRLDLKLEIIKS